MRKLFMILATVLSISLFAQSPEKMSYQAVVRDANDNLITNTQVNMQISILQGAGGTAVYVETQEPTTNANGLISIEIGNGTSSDDFSSIDWSNGPYFIKTEIDPTGGYSYTITGTSQLLSVPYALHAKTAESITGDINIDETDPVYSSSEASNITGTDVNEWNAAHSWGNHADAGYITELGDLSSYATKEELGDSIEQIRSEMDGITTITTTQANAIIANSGKDTTGIYHANREALDSVSGINTGDQDISGIATNEQAIIELNDSISMLNDSIKELRADINSQTSGGATTYSVGDIAQGGIIFWLDETGQHGLVSATEDQNGGAGIRWYAGTDGTTRATGNGIYAGEMNTSIIISAHVAIGDDGNDYAAQLCNDLEIIQNGITYGDWYLPSRKELIRMYNEKDLIGGFNTNGDFSYYWSSTDQSSSGSNNIGYVKFSTGIPGYAQVKSASFKIRAIRSF